MNKSPNPANSNGANQPSEELRQQLWELSYGLLEDDAAAELRARIKSDPVLARLYAEVRLQTDLVASASRVEDTSLHISARPDSQVGRAGRLPSLLRSRDARSAGSGHWVNWLAVGGTVALLLLLSIGLLRPEETKVAVAQLDYVYTTITAPPAEEGLPQLVELETRDIANNGRSEEVDVRLINQEGKEVFRQKARTQADGRGQVELPGEVVHPGSRLEVTAGNGRGDESRAVSAELKVAEEQKHTFMLTDKPFAEPGEPMRFSMLTVTKNSKKTVLPSTDELMVERGEGESVVQPMWTADPGTGIINGEFELPRETDVNGLAVRRSRGVVADAKQKSAEEDSKLETRKQVEKFFLQSQPERSGAMPRQQSTLERGLAMQQRRNGESKDEAIRKSASVPTEQPSSQAGALPGTGGEGNANRGGLKPGEGPTKPFGAAADKPAMRAVAPQEPASPPTAASPRSPAPPAPPRAEPPAPVAAPIALAPAPSLAPAPAPATVNAPAGGPLAGDIGSRDKNEQNAPATAASGVGPGRTLAKQRPDAEEAPGLSLPDPSAKREAELTFSKANELAAASTETYTSLQQLKFQVEGLQDSYEPNEKVELKVRVVDEQGRPVPAALGVRVWNDLAAKTTTAPLTLADAFEQEIQGERELALAQDGLRMAAAATDRRLEANSTVPGTGIGDNAKKDLASRAKEAQTDKSQNALAANLPAMQPSGKPQAEPSLPAVQDLPAQVESETRHFKELDEKVASIDREQPFSSAETDLVVADNRAEVQRDYALALESSKMHRAEQWQHYGRILIWSAGGLLVVLGLLLMTRQPVRTGVLIPAVGLCVLSLALGVAWFVPNEPAGFTLAFNETPKAATPTPAATTPDSSDERRLLGSKSSVTTSGESEIGEQTRTAPEAESLKRLDQKQAFGSANGLGQGQGGVSPSLPLPELKPSSEAFSPPAGPAATKSNSADALQPTADIKAELAKALDPAANGARAELRNQAPVNPADKAAGEKGQAPSGGTSERAGAGKPETAKGGTLADAAKPAGRPGSAPAGYGGGALGGGARGGGFEAQTLEKKAAEKLKEERRDLDRAAGLAAPASAPDSLFWRSLSPVDADGTLTIEFTMPAIESDYRLILDAIGNGRLGSQQQLLICREAK